MNTQKREPVSNEHLIEVGAAYLRGKADALAEAEVRSLRSQDKPSEGRRCDRCAGSGMVDDGEINHYEGTNIPFENGPVKCVKDCPVCRGSGIVAPSQPIASDVVAVGTPWPMKHEPMGTNLLSADQARAMLEHVIGASPDVLSRQSPVEADK